MYCKHSYIEIFTTTWELLLKVHLLHLLLDRLQFNKQELLQKKEGKDKEGERGEREKEGERIYKIKIIITTLHYFLKLTDIL